MAEGDDGHIRGYALATPPNKGQSWIVSLAVDPAVQGMRVGRQLMRETLKSLRAAGTGTVLLWVEPANDHAIALYESLGFVRDPAGTRPDHFGPGADRLLMSLPLSD